MVTRLLPLHRRRLRPRRFPPVPLRAESRGPTLPESFPASHASRVSPTPPRRIGAERSDTQWGNWQYYKCPIRGCFVCCGAHQVDTYIPAVTDQLRPFFKQLPLTKMKCFCSNTLNLTMSNSERNPGRLFFKCSKHECDFFQWADEEPMGNRRRWLEGEKFTTLFNGRVVKRKPQDVLWKTPLQKGVREIIDKHMTDTTPKERSILEKRGMGPYEGNWHPDEANPMKKMNEQDIQQMVRKEVEWHLYK